MKPSDRRVASWQAIREYERHREKWDRDVSRGWSGRGLLRRVHAGQRLRPYDLSHRIPPEHRRELWGWTSHATPIVVGWIVACWTIRKGVVCIDHATLGRLVGCSTRTAGSAMREAVACGLIERRWHYRRDRIGTKLRYTQLTSSYRPTRILLGLLKGGNRCQPTEHSPYGTDQTKGAPVGAGRSGASCGGREGAGFAGGRSGGSKEPDCRGQANVVSRYRTLIHHIERAIALGPPVEPDPRGLAALCPGYGVRGHAGCALCAPQVDHV